VKKGRYRGRWSDAVNLKSSERVALYLLKMRRVAQGLLLKGGNKFRDLLSRLNRGPIVGWNDGSQKFRALQPEFS